MRTSCRRRCGLSSGGTTTDCRRRADLDRLGDSYLPISIKLDKPGGLTKALALAAEVTQRDFRIMVGGAIGMSLGITPALLLAQHAEMADLDGPLFFGVRSHSEAAL